MKPIKLPLVLYSHGNEVMERQLRLDRIDGQGGFYYFKIRHDPNENQEVIEAQRFIGNNILEATRNFYQILFAKVHEGLPDDLGNKILKEASTKMNKVWNSKSRINVTRQVHNTFRYNGESAETWIFYEAITDNYYFECDSGTLSTLAPISASSSLALENALLKFSQAFVERSRMAETKKPGLKETLTDYLKGQVSRLDVLLINAGYETYGIPREELPACLLPEVERVGADA